jgi:hypothetical protein
MALPKHLQPALTPDELTFLAEHDHIDIVPSFSMSRVRLLSVSLPMSGLSLDRQECHGRVTDSSRAYMDPFNRHLQRRYLYGWRSV